MIVIGEVRQFSFLAYDIIMNSYYLLRIPSNPHHFFASIDHCADVTANFGVVSQRTPRGMQLSEFHQGLEKYIKEAMERETK